MNAREEILGRVRAALRTARIPAEPPPPPPSSPLESAPSHEWRARFAAELRALGVALHEEASDAAVAERVVALIGTRRLLAWPDATLPPAVAARLAQLPAGQRLDLAAPRAALATAEVGLTAVDAAIAETGSLLLIAAHDRPRTPSLLPPLHVAIVRGSDLVPTLRAALAKLRHALPSAAALHRITGPSRTADIELQLTLGVHGPGALAVVLGP
ncbi:MAG: LUD domain-containing protein [Planctomycetes bacterium]|nr:LUD domain-containing protein [Planctomycetota bacterium]